MTTYDFITRMIDCGFSKEYAQTIAAGFIFPEDDDLADQYLRLQEIINNDKKQYAKEI